MSCVPHFQSDPEHITVDFAVSAIERRMEYMMREHGAKVFIIDFLPNLRYLLKMNKLAEDCTESMQKFEAKVGLYSNQDTVLYALDTLCSVFSKELIG